MRLIDWVVRGQRWVGQDILLILFFGVPMLLLACWLLIKKTQFKEYKKVRRQERLFRLPFSSAVSLGVFTIAALFLAVGLAMLREDKNTATGLYLALFSLLVIVIMAVCTEHPKIWFSDTFNTWDTIEAYKSNPSGAFSDSRDGVFSYSDGSFTLGSDKEAKTIEWNDIDLISAYKQDLLTVDCIVIGIHFRQGSVSISDQSEGFVKFMELASQKLPHFNKDWFMELAFPAFETKQMIIYKKRNDEAL